MTDATNLDFPLPKYRNGARVWQASTTTQRSDLPCPDCLGTKRWRVTTPAGSELEAECQRCASYGAIRNVPSLTSLKHIATVRGLTIGSVEIKSSVSWEGDAKIKYMCIETGVGSGSVYNEHDLFETEDAACAVAEGMANLANTKEAAKPERIEQMTFSHLSLHDAKLKAADDAIWGAWYRYRALRDDVEKALGDDSRSAAELREDLQHHLKWDKGHRVDARPFEKILEAAKTAAARWADKDLMEALHNLPSIKARAEEIARELAS